MSDNILKTCIVKGHPRQNSKFVEDHYRKPRGLLEGMRRVDSTSKRETNFTIENQHKWNELKNRFLDQVFSFKEVNSTNVTVTIDFDLLKTQSFENRREFFTLCKQSFKVQDYTRIRVEWKRYSARDFKSKKKSRSVSASLTQSHFTTQHLFVGPAHPPISGPDTSIPDGYRDQIHGPIANGPLQPPNTFCPSTYSGGGQGSQYSQMTPDYSHAYPPRINPTTSIHGGHQGQIHGPNMDYPSQFTSPTNHSFRRQGNEVFPNAMMSEHQPPMYQQNISSSVYNFGQFGNDRW